MSNLEEKVQEKLTPDQKKGLENVADKVEQTGADAKKKINPENKSSIDSVKEKLQEGSDELKKVWEENDVSGTAQEYLDAAKKHASDAAEYVQNSIGGKK